MARDYRCANVTLRAEVFQIGSSVSSKGAKLVCCLPNSATKLSRLRIAAAPNLQPGGFFQYEIN